MTSPAIHEERLQAWLQHWQRRLRLQDWLVTVTLVRAREIDGNFGRSRSNQEHKQAWIQIMDPADADPQRFCPYDMETTLVHELLHLHLLPLAPKDGTLEDTAFEQAINLIAHALTGKP